MFRYRFDLTDPEKPHCLWNSETGEVILRTADPDELGIALVGANEAAGIEANYRFVDYTPKGFLGRSCGEESGEPSSNAPALKPWQEGDYDQK